MANKNNNTNKRGFASMPHDKVVKIASMGGHASHKHTTKTEENKGSHTTSLKHK